MHHVLPQSICNPDRSWLNRKITTPPIWCAVDLRDGSQALAAPLAPAAKRKYLQILLDIGFREIEIGFPTASQDDWQFCRDVITQELLPEDAWMSVLMPCRPQLITRTMECLRGCRQAILHLYIATSELHTKFVLGFSRKQLLDVVRESVQQLKVLAQKQPQSRFRLEFSPEEFTDSDPELILELAQVVTDIWNPAPGEKVIMNLPCTVERALPLHYAEMVADFKARQPYPDKTIISIHNHNDMGTAIAEAELALMAGADRVEGTLFGNGERAGNLDLVTLAVNLQYFGVNTGLDFSRLDAIRNEITDLTRIPVHPRHPYAGALAFTAFSGTHQDAIRKGLDKQQEITDYFGGWKLPYLHIAPEELGKSYQRCVRINSQSGKGGLAFVLQEFGGITLPEALLAEFSQKIQRVTDESAAELDPQVIHRMLRQEYVKLDAPVELQKFWPRPDPSSPSTIYAEVHVIYQKQLWKLTGVGQGPVSAFAAALRQLPLPKFLLETYEERALGQSVNADSISIVSISDSQKQIFYGLGFGANIVQGAAEAIVSALNRMLANTFPNQNSDPKQPITSGPFNQKS